MDQTDPWQVVPRQVFTPLLISVAFVVLCRVGCLGVTFVFIFGMVRSFSSKCSRFRYFCAGLFVNLQGQIIVWQLPPLSLR